MEIVREFREFVMRGNVIDMAVGIIIGAAFGAIVASLVEDIIMPPVGLILGGVSFEDLFLVLRAAEPGARYATLADAREAGAVTINYGTFINRLVSFLIIAFAVFMLVRTINRLRRLHQGEPAPTEKPCPFCAMTIPVRATRCPHCTSALEAA